MTADEPGEGKRNPPWNWDELLLALDLYLTSPASPPGKDSAAVAELSAILSKMHQISGVAGGDTLRNANGVYLKMMNFRSADPAFVAQGKVGMTRGNKLEAEVWAAYQGRREALAADAAAIRAAVAIPLTPAAAPVADDPYEAEEGGVIVRLHRSYERDRKLIAAKKKAAKAAGALACEACEFDFAKAYGALGEDFIEVHHLRPVHAMQPGQKTKLSDLALLCSNCHRMAHRNRQVLSLDGLRAALQHAADSP